MPVKRPCIERMPDGRGCRNYAVEGKSRCDEHERERRRNAAAEGRTGGRMGSRPGWKALRAKVWSEQGERCARCGCKPTGYEVHHRNGIGTDDTRANLEGLCEPCHRRADEEVRDANRARREASPMARRRRRRR
jgi:5-methylcytosine-specific restriction endonuclease McrA